MQELYEQNVFSEIQSEKLCMHWEKNQKTLIYLEIVNFVEL
jgi:hypothetical protein